jgi:hypothetical protein
VAAPIGRHHARGRPHQQHRQATTFWRADNDVGAYLLICAVSDAPADAASKAMRRGRSGRHVTTWDGWATHLITECPRSERGSTSRAHEAVVMSQITRARMAIKE